MCDQTGRQYHSDRPNSSMEEFELIGAYSSDPIIISPSLLKLVDQCNKYVNDDNYVPLESFTLTKKTKKLIDGDIKKMKFIMNGQKYIAFVAKKCHVCDNWTQSKCRGCKNVYYCSKKCQKIHWKDGHKNNCCV